jgi:hypothetical protein
VCGVVLCLRCAATAPPPHHRVLYSTFAYPCIDVPVRREPDYVLPYCYYMQPPALKTSHLAKFQLETLFYIFYNMPKDTLQVYAAKELYVTHSLTPNFECDAM